MFNALKAQAVLDCSNRIQNIESSVSAPISIIESNSDIVCNFSDFGQPHLRHVWEPE
jgi:hypothetical protein